MKRIIIAVLLSLFGPGLGQLYNKDYKKGIILLVVSSLLIFVPVLWLYLKVVPELQGLDPSTLTPQRVQELTNNAVGNNKHILNLITFMFLGLWAYTITQAYFGAKEINDKEAEKDENREEE